jgi:hypothetical protein
METITAKALLPNKFEPLRNDRWVLMIDGIDAFLVKTVQAPIINTSSTQRELIVALYNEVGGDQNVRLKAWVEMPISKPGELKFLDPVGKVVELWKFRAKPERMWFDKFDYSDTSLMATYVAFDLSEFDITKPQ